MILVMIFCQISIHALREEGDGAGSAGGVTNP